MLNKGQAGEIFTRIKEFASADEVEVSFFSTANALTRFANNIIHQNMAEENVVVSVRTAFGRRTARATTNKLDDESLRRVVEASEKLARVQHADEDLLPMFAGNSKAAARAPALHVILRRLPQLLRRTEPRRLSRLSVSRSGTR